MQPPHPYWADHDHSDEHINLLYTRAPARAPNPEPPPPPPPPPRRQLPPTTPRRHRDPAPPPPLPPQQRNPPPPLPLRRYNSPRPRRRNPSVPNNQHANDVYNTVREQGHHFSPLFAPTHAITPNDSGYSSRSEMRRGDERRRSRLANMTPSPPDLIPEEDLANVELRSQSSEWSSDEDGPGSTSALLRGAKAGKKKKENKARGRRALKKAGNICSRGLRRVRECLGKVVLAAAGGKKRGSPIDSQGFEMADLALDGSSAGRMRLEEEESRAGEGEGEGEGLLKKMKRKLFGRKGPVHLKPAKVRFPLD